MSATPIPPLFFDSEYRAGRPATALLIRRLMRWQSWARDYWTRVTPPGRNLDSAAGDSWFGSTGGSTKSFYIAAPQVPCRRLSYRWKAASANGQIVMTVRSRRTGAVLHQSTIASQSGADGSGTFTIDAPDVIDCTATIPGAGPNQVYGFSAWWDLRADVPSGITLPTIWGAIGSALGDTDRPDSAAVIRWLVRSSNLMVADRPQMATASTDLSSLNVPLVVSPRVPSITVRSLHRTGSLVPSFSLYYHTPALGQGTLYNGGVAPGAFGWATTVIPIQNHPHESLLHVDLRSGSSDIAAILAYETEITSGSDLVYQAAGGTVTIPASFVTLEDASIVARAAMIGDADPLGGRGRGRKAMIENMIWLMAKKTRVLCCLSEVQNLGTATDGTQAYFRMRTANDGVTRQIRIRGLLAPSTASSTQKYSWSQWQADQGGAASWKDLTVAGGVGAEAWVTEDDHSVAPNSEFVFRRRRQNPSAEATVAEYVRSAIIEELPNGTPLTTWP